MDNYYSSYINEIQSSQSTRKSSIIANPTNKKELNIKNKNFANNKINTSKNLSNYINTNKKSLSLTNEQKQNEKHIEINIKNQDINKDDKSKKSKKCERNRKKKN